MLHCHHLNDSCIKMGSGESHVLFVSFIVTDKATGRESINHNFCRESKAETGNKFCHCPIDGTSSTDRKV